MAKLQYTITKKEMDNITKAIYEIQNVRLFLVPDAGELTKERRLLANQLWNVMDLLKDIEST